MVLKAAYFSAVGFTGAQPITRQDLRSAAQTATTLGVAWPGPNLFHDIRAWADLLIAYRTASPRLAYPLPGFGSDIRARAQALQRIWTEVLRYHNNVAYRFEMNQARAAADWLLVRAWQL
jgi:hypothetical protein